MLTRRPGLTVLLLSFVGSPLATAEPAFDAKAAAKKLAPFIDQHTLFVGRVDLRRLDAATLLKFAEPIALLPAETRTAIQAAQTALLRQGAQEIFVVYGARDFPNKPCLLVPSGETPSDMSELLKTLYGKDESAWVNRNGFLCLGTKPGLERLKACKPSPRTDIVEALTGVGDGAAQAVFAPSADMRSIFEQIAPTLPKEVGGGPIQTLTHGLKWVGLAVGPTPKAELRVTVACADAAAATKILALIQRGLEDAQGMLNVFDSEERPAYAKIYRRVVELLTPKVDKDRLVLALELGAVVPELTNLVKNVQPSARSRSISNLKQVGLACFNYEDVHGRFPVDIKSKDGKPLLSWRVAILPYVEQEQLYKQFKLDEPWDSEHNKKLIARMPALYRSPKQSADLKDRTTYLAPLGKGLMWDDPTGTRLQDVLDGISNTILLVEADDKHAVIWSQPEDIKINRKEPTKGLVGHWEDGFLALMADGSARFVDKDYSAIWAMFTKAGGEEQPEK
jgi:hypothetical protein